MGGSEGPAGGDGPGQSSSARHNHVSGYVGKLPNYRKNANFVNAEAVSYIKHSYTPTGIVMMDFAGTNTSRGATVHGEDLVRALIENNN